MHNQTNNQTNDQTNNQTNNQTNDQTTKTEIISERTMQILGYNFFNNFFSSIKTNFSHSAKKENNNTTVQRVIAFCVLIFNVFFLYILFYGAFWFVKNNILSQTIPQPTEEQKKPAIEEAPQKETNTTEEKKEAPEAENTKEEQEAPAASM